MISLFYGSALAALVTFDLENHRCHQMPSGASADGGHIWKIVDRCDTEKPDACGAVIDCPGNVLEGQSAKATTSLTKADVQDAVRAYLAQADGQNVRLDGREFRGLTLSQIVDQPHENLWDYVVTPSGERVPVVSLVREEFPFAVPQGSPKGWTTAWETYLRNERARIVLSRTKQIEESFAECAGGDENGGFCVDAHASFRRLVLSLPEMPPSRLTCEVYQASGQRLSISWDPVIDSPLTQTLTLPKPEVPGDNRWAISCWSRPELRMVKTRTEAGGTGATQARQDFEGEVDLSWTPSRAAPKSTDRGLISSWEVPPGQAVNYPTYEVKSGIAEALTGVAYFNVPRINFPASLSTVVGEDKRELRAHGRVPSIVIRTDLPMLTIRQLPTGTTDEARDQLLAGDLTGQAGQRSFLDATAPSVVTDTLDILADIALERAEAGAAAAISEAMSWVVCEDLALEHPTTLRYGIVLPEGLLLPATCDVVRGVPLMELVNSSAALGKAVQTDAVHFGFGVLSRSTGLDASLQSALTTHVIPVLEAVSPTLLDVIASQQAPSAREYRMMLAALAKHDWTPDTTPTLAECGTDMAVTVAAACVGGGGCDADRITDMLDRPERYFDVPDDGCLTVFRSREVRAWERLRPQLASIAAHLIDAALPGADVDERTRAARVFEVMFEVSALLVREVVVPPQDIDKRAFAVSLIEHLEDLVRGLLMEDERAYLTAGLAVLRDVVDHALEEGLTPSEVAACDRTKGPLKNAKAQACADRKLRPDTQVLKGLRIAVERVTPWAVVLANHAEMLRLPAETEEEAARAREARETAIKGLIDATTSRQNRDGNWVASIGANVGFRYGTAFNAASDGDPLMLPMGVAVQLLPNRDSPAILWDAKSRQRLGVGLHTQATFFDLSNFLRYDEPKEMVWNDFVTPGLQAGLIVGTPTVPFVIGADARYRVATESPEFSVFLTYYVPFLDFN
jgi:hypothetical protein